MDRAARRYRGRRRRHSRPGDPVRFEQGRRTYPHAGSPGARFSIVVAAEGATPVGGGRVVVDPGSALRQERLGGIGFRVASDLERAIGRETRCVLLGHLQRGGAPTSADRLLATRFGVHAVELVLARDWGCMVALTPPTLTAVALERVVNRQRTVPHNCDLIRA